MPRYLRYIAIAAVASSAVAIAASPFNWVNYYVLEGQVIGGHFTKDDALQWAGKHILQTGHTVQTRPVE